MSLILSVYNSGNSKFNTYFNANLGHFLKDGPNVFHLPLKLYNYWARKEKLNIRGVKKIVVEISEFHHGGLLLPGTALGAIVQSNNYFNFEHLISIEELDEKRLYFIMCYHQILKNLCIEFGWDIGIFKVVYEKTVECIKLNSYPKDFDEKKIVI